MEKRLGVKPNPASWILSGYYWQTSAKWLRSLYLFYTCFCFSVLWLSTDASESRCQQGKTQFGVGLRSGGENHLWLLEGTPSLQSCWAACCQDSACHVFWWLEGMCIQADCSRPQSCRAFRTHSSNSMLVFLKKFQTADDLGFLPEDDVPHLLGLGWNWASWRQSPPRAALRPAVSSSDQQSLIRKLQKRGSPSDVVTPIVTQHSKVNDSNELGGLTTSGSAEGVRTPTLQLSAMQEGDYTYQLTVTDTIGQQATAQVTVIVQPENNKPPQADAGPDKELTLPVDSTTLDGSKSSDDQKIISYLWEKTQGPDGVQLENANSSVATVTGLQVGTYVFTLTVKDERNLQSQSSVNVIVKEEINKPPIAKITGNVVITLPTSTAELDGSKSSDDKGIVSYLWTRDEGSPAAGEVLNHSDHHPILFLSNLVEGTYTFHLKVTDAKGESDTDRTTVEVKPDPRKNNLVEIILDINVSQLTERLKGMFIRQIGVLLGVLDSDIIVQKIQPYTEQSTKMVFFVQNEPPHQIFKGHEVAAMLKSELRKQKADFLIFRALEVNTVTCQLNCSDHGHCDSFTKRCICDPFWMENFIKVQLRDGDSNCEWSVLYVIIATFVIVVALGILSWTVICCCKRQKGKPKRKSKYKILDATDQESLELKPTSRAGIKQKGLLLSSSLMHSESELDSDDAIFTWPDREKGKLLHGQNGSVPNGQTPLKARSPREEIL
uniref:KIAA0319 like n=1 Tax=Homo sapiens TaxID=9606 RepID=A0A8V8TKL9_HUMAN